VALFAVTTVRAETANLNGRDPEVLELRLRSRV
jgi:hypothetical protein